MSCTVGLLTGAEPAPRTPTVEETVLLSPFEVAAEKDYGYTAANTLSGGRLSTSLQQTPAAISVLTREFLDDLGVSDIQQALAWTTNSQAAGNSDVAADATISNNLNGQPQMAGNGNAVTIRGFGSTIARNYFPWFVNSDAYNTERIDISRGPNAMLFGDAAAGGVVNVSTKRARPGQSVSSTQFRTSNEGGHRFTLDIGRPLTSRGAVRINALRERSKDWRDYHKLDRDGVHGAASLNLGKNIQLRAESEWGLVDRRSPALYLRDRTSAWNGLYTLPTRLTGTQSPAAGVGVVRVDTGSNANQPFNVMDLSRPELGFLDWQGSVRTDGLTSSLQTSLPAHVAATGTHTAVPVDAPAVLGRREFRVVPDYGYAVNTSAYRGKNEYRAHSLFYEHRILSNLFVEAAGTYQSQHSVLYTPASHNSIYIDVNEFLPAGVTIDGSNRNPNFLRPYNESSSSFDLRAIYNKTRIQEGRLSAVYLLSTPWTRQRLGLIYTVRNQDLYNVGAGDFRRINGTNPNTGARANQLFFRTYLPEGRSLSQERFEYGRGPYELPGGVLADFVGTTTRTFIHAESTQAFASGSWFKGDRLTTTLGVRRDYNRTERYSLPSGAKSGANEGTVNSPSVGAVVDLLPGLSIYGSASKTFLATLGGLAFSFQDEPLPLRRGEGRDVGLKFSLWKGRLSGSAGYYKSEETNSSSSRQDIGSEINDIRNTMGLQTGNTFSIFNDTQDATATGWEFDLTANLNKGWSLSANCSLPKSVLSNSLPRYRKYLAVNRPVWESYAANPANTGAARVQENLADIDLILARNADGLPRPNQADYLANVFTRYRATRGALAGLSIGGGVNIVGPRLMSLRIGQPNAFSGSYHTLSALMGYDRKWRRISGNFQLNVANLLDQQNFRYTSLLASGTPQLFRISDPRKLTLTVTLKF